MVRHTKCGWRSAHLVVVNGASVKSAVGDAEPSDKPFEIVHARDINRAQIHAWKQGIKTIYYIRLRQLALEGTEVQGCVSCSL